MKKLLVLVFVLSVILSVFSAPKGEDMILTLTKISSPTSFKFKEIPYAKLAGVSGIRKNSPIFEKGKELTENFLKNNYKNYDKDNKIKAKVYKVEKKYKNGKKKTYYYIIIYGKKLSLNEYLIKNGIGKTNKYTKYYFNIIEVKKLENYAKENKLGRWGIKKNKKGK
jgi:hypothetical protein